MPDELLATAERALEKAARRADEAEVVLRDDEVTSTTLRGAHATGRSAARTLIGVRLRIGRRVGIASAALVDDHVVDHVIEQARLVTSVAAESKTDVGFSRGERIATRAFRVDAPPPGTERSRENARAIAEDVARAAEYYTVLAGGSRARVVIANVNGTMAGDASESSWLTVEARVREERARAVVANRLGRAALSIDGFAEEVVRDLRLGQKLATIAPGKRDVLFDAETASRVYPSLLVHFASGLVRQGVSRFAGKVGEEVLSPAITFRDEVDGGVAGGRAREVDDEGVRTRTRDLLARGRFLSPVYNTEEAALAGVKDAPGNGFRGKDVVDTPPRSTPVNLTLAPGKRTIAEMAASLRDGILVRHELLGWYHTTSVSGLVSVVAPCAFLVKDGAIASGLPPVTLGFDVLAALAHPDVEVGSESVATSHGVCAPLLLRDVAVSV